MASRTTPYKIAVFGPGDVGCIVIREATRLPEFEVVGALVVIRRRRMAWTSAPSPEEGPEEGCGGLL
ncbi:hypothetical protein BU16DRAFT_528609 [Lophium mytilinum]|uniref:Uncharacterized protein n=1 Tax=Lophium mytilinum TaxID=390894 RepID=A0A6A6QNH8_9PEZI|nr:hypothetical protein BU16DRAFT_528609 [Lophium mytilinum]